MNLCYPNENSLKQQCLIGTRFNQIGVRHKILVLFVTNLKFAFVLGPNFVDGPTYDNRSDFWMPSYRINHN